MSEHAFSTGVVVHVNPAGPKPRKNARQFTCPSCKSVYDLAATGGEVPVDFVFACDAPGCGYIGPVPA
jgi:hypothetical protein